MGIYNEFTNCIYGDHNPDKLFGAVAPPIFQNSMFSYKNVEEAELFYEKGIGDHFLYTRADNPTTRILEKKMARLEKTDSAKIFASGMAAISSAILAVIESNSHVICIHGCYSCTYHILKDYLYKFNVEVDFNPMTDVSEVEALIKDNTKLIYLESPTSASFNIIDIKAITKLAKKYNIKTIIDNSTSTPINQTPVDFGVDIMVHSASKYIGGHSDVVAGVVCGDKEFIGKMWEEEGALFGGIASPFNSWLMIRGLRTLPIRMVRHNENGMKVAKFLESHPKVERVFYPGLESFPNHDIACRQMKGFSGMLSFDIVNNKDLVRKFVNALKLFNLAVSWGGYESIVFPFYLARLANERLYGKQERNIEDRVQCAPDGMVRMSIGLENPDDLIQDIEDALKLI